MTLKAVIRVGDPLSHGGAVITGSTILMSESIPVSRLGDEVLCSQHGTQTIVSGVSPCMNDESIPVAVDGAVCSCGALVVATTTLTYAE